MASLRVAEPDFTRAHLGAEQAHAEHVRLLPLDVALAHVDDALQAEARRHRRGRDAVLAGAGLGDDAALAHAPGEQDLADRVVDLVRAGVGELVALEVDARAAELGAEPLGEIQAGSAGRHSRRARRRARPERPDRLGRLVGAARARGSAASGSRRRSGRHRCRTGRARRGRPDRCWAGSSAGTRGGCAGRGLRRPPRPRRRARGSAGSSPGPCGRGGDSTPGRDVDRGRPAQRDRGGEVVGRQAAREQPRAADPQVLQQAPVEGEPVAARQAARLLGRPRVEQQHVGDRGVARDRRQVPRLGHLSALITAQPVRALIARTRSGLSAPCSCTAVERNPRQNPSSSASSGSTNTPTVVRSAGAARARSPACSGLSARGEGG